MEDVVDAEAQLEQRRRSEADEDVVDAEAQLEERRYSEADEDVDGDKKKSKGCSQPPGIYIKSGLEGEGKLALDNGTCSNKPIVGLMIVTLLQKADGPLGYIHDNKKSETQRVVPFLIVKLYSSVNR